MGAALASPSRAPAPAHACADLVFTVPGPPRGKGRHHARIVKPKFGKAPFVQEYPDQATVVYESHVRKFASDAMAGRPLFDGPLVLAMWAYFPIAASWSLKKQVEARSERLVPTGRPDLDNIVKVKDACNGVVWRDDAQVVKVFAEKLYSDRPRLVIRVSHRVPPALPDPAAARPEPAGTLALFGGAP